MNDPILSAADQLYNAYQSGISCGPVRDLIGETNLDSAYKVQLHNVDRWIAGGRRVVGCKIGLTAKAVQAQFGIDQPDYGVLFEDMIVPNGSKLYWEDVKQPKIESEIAFVLAKDLDKTTLTIAEVEAAIDYASPAIEIAGSRVLDWNIRIADTIADNASASHFVLGDEKKKLGDFDRLNCKMQLLKNGDVASEGLGSACLGDPIEAVRWLAETMAKLGRPLLKGHIVMSGALGPMVGAAEGDRFETTIEGLGRAEFQF